jgi:hypothetical protein
MREFLSHSAVILGSGLILLFFSEFLFVNETLAPTLFHSSSFSLIPIVKIAELIIWYSLFACWFLIPAYLFNVQNKNGIILTAAIYGWIVEGLTIPYLYMEMPFSIVWTSMSWHLVIDIILGWWAVRWILQKNNYLFTIALAIGIGLFWGIWATWNNGNNTEPLNPHDFFLISSLGTTLWIAGNITLDKLVKFRFQPTKPWILGLLIGSTLIFVATTWALTPLQLILPALIMITAYTLKQGNKKDPPAAGSTNIIWEMSSPQKTIFWRNHLILLLTPIAANLTYPIYASNNTALEPWIIATPLIILGVGIYTLATIKNYTIAIKTKPL